MKTEPAAGGDPAAVVYRLDMLTRRREPITAVKVYVTKDVADTLLRDVQRLGTAELDAQVRFRVEVVDPQTRTPLCTATKISVFSTDRGTANMHVYGNENFDATRPDPKLQPWVLNPPPTDPGGGAVGGECHHRGRGRVGRWAGGRGGRRVRDLASDPPEAGPEAATQTSPG